MRKFKIFLIMMIISLFISGVFAYQPYIPQGSMVQINPAIINGNYTWINPGYIQTISTCTPEKISTDENEYASSPFVYEDYAAWIKGYDMYLWEKGGSAVKTTIEKYSTLYDLNDNKILYKYHDKVYLYDVISKTKSQISISTQAAYVLSYDNNELAYLYDNGTYFLSGLTTKKINIFNNDTYLSAPSLYNGNIAWAEEADNGYLQIFYWNGSTINQITMTDYDNFYPSLYAGKIVWYGKKDGHFQIFYWNGNTITQITDTTYDNFVPKLYNGKIVWYGKKDGHFQIFYWNGSSIKQLTNNNNSNILPDIYNGRIVWKAKNSSGVYGDVYTCMAETPLKPSVSYGTVTNKTSTSVKLNGSVNPNGESTTYKFQYGTTSSYTASTSWLSVGSGTSSSLVNRTIGNLTPDTTYHYRIIAKNTNGQTNGVDQTFKTLAPTPVLPTAITDNITSIDPYTLSAIINPNGFDTTFYFEYGTDTNYGDNTSVSGAGAGETNVTVTTQLSDLQANTTYHYRVVAQNAAGTVEGDDKTFTTPADIIPTINVPSGQHTYSYLPIENPVLNIDPESSKPFAVGNILGGTLSLKVGLKAFNNPVDIYLAITKNQIPGLYFIVSNPTVGIQTDLVAWKTNQTNAIDESLFENINTNDLPEGTYTLYTLVVPTGATNMDNSYLWITSFSIAH